jgi:hypothetical protein
MQKGLLGSFLQEVAWHWWVCAFVHVCAHAFAQRVFVRLLCSWASVNDLLRHALQTQPSASASGMEVFFLKIFALEWNFEGSQKRHLGQSNFEQKRPY